MNKIIIGLAGVKTSGKSTVANIIQNVFGHRPLESALANKLKDVSAEVFGVPRDHFDDQDFKEAPFKDGPILLDFGHIAHILSLFKVEMVLSVFVKKYKHLIGTPLETPRRIAQIVGTEILRATGDEDIHCKNMPLNDKGITIVSDIRFPNEFNYFNNLEGYSFFPLYVQRDEAEKHVTEDSHRSEKCVFEFAHKCIPLPNNGDLDDLDINTLQLLRDEGVLGMVDYTKQA